MMASLLAALAFGNYYHVAITIMWRATPPDNITTCMPDQLLDQQAETCAAFGCAGGKPLSLAWDAIWASAQYSNHLVQWYTLEDKQGKQGSEGSSELTSTSLLEAIEICHSKLLGQRAHKYQPAA
jgi:hypothetical protein